jgi:hypothetical protein
MSTPCPEVDEDDVVGVEEYELVLRPPPQVPRKPIRSYSRMQFVRMDNYDDGNAAAAAPYDER